MKIVATILLLCSLSSCGLFSTRTPAEPDLGSTFFWTPAATPTMLLDNFKGSLQVADAANYAKCFISSHDSAAIATTYQFNPRIGIDQNSLARFDGWSVQSEQNFLTTLRASLVKNPRLEVTLSNIKSTQSNATVASIQADYTISFPLASNSSLPESIVGSLIFDMELITTEGGTQEWRIVTWTDFLQPASTAKTFTDIKVQLAS